MRINSVITCDICQEPIDAEEDSLITLERPALETFLASGPDEQPTWQEVGNGTGQIRLHICIDCQHGMRSFRMRPPNSSQ